MADVKRCDRCGIHYKKRDPENAIKKDNSKFYIIRESETYFDIDLCGTCREDFDEFLKGYAIDKNNKVDIFATINKITDIETPKKTTLFNKMFHIKR